MNPANYHECDVRIGGVWKTVSIADALKKHWTTEKRCAACHGPITVQGPYSDGAHANFSHLKAHSGCPLKPSSFSGTPSLHPDALA